MADEESMPPAPTSAPAETPPVPLAPAAEVAPTPVPESAPTPAVGPIPPPSPETPAPVPSAAVEAMSIGITEAVTKAIMGGSESVPEAYEVSPPTQQPAPAALAASALAEMPIKARRGEALEKRRAIKRERLLKIMQFAASGEEFGNDAIEDILPISNPTVTKYLGELVRVGRLKRSGTRKGTLYRRI